MDNSRPIHVVATRPLSATHIATIEAVSPRIRFSIRPGKTYEERCAALTPEVEVLFADYADFPITEAASLRWIQFETAGVDHVHASPVWESQITLTNASGAHANSLPEFVLGGILAHYSHLPRLLERQQRAYWTPWHDRADLMRDGLRGRTIGIIGYGAIGREIARLAQAFGMRVLATKRAERPTKFDGFTMPGTGDPQGSIPAAYYTLDRLGELLAESDVIVLVLPLSSESQGLIGAAELAQMKPHALLVNIGRGGLIDHAALITALRANKIGGAFLDVTEPEPLPAESPLWTMDRVIITPHMGGFGRNYLDDVIAVFTENLRRYAAGEPLLNVVQRERGY